MLNKKALAATAAANPVYVEDVFSTYLYTGNTPSTQSIVNGIDLAGEGGMVWCKLRDGTYNHILMDTARGTGTGNILYGNLTLAAQTASNAGISSFNSNGFSLRYDDGYGTNYPSGQPFASWTFRKAEKFFDVVTWTGDGTNGRTISHNLGSTPGCVIVKRTDTTGAWVVRHAAGGGINLLLNTTVAGDDPTTYANGNVSAFNSTTFTVSSGSTINAVNANGATYVAYLFAHDAGGFGDSGSESVIKCGSYTGNEGTQNIDLGWEPQWLLVKRADSSTLGSWHIIDNMRGFVTDTNCNYVAANSANAETDLAKIGPRANGFGLTGETSSAVNANGATYIYIAIRRGPMKTPTVGSDVFRPRAQNASSTTVVPTTFPVDLIIGTQRSRATFNSTAVFDRLRGTRGVASGGKWLATNSTNAETSDYGQDIDRMGDFLDLFFNTAQGVTSSTAYWAFRRAPGFFDIVCYTGTGANRTVTHNLGVAPELMIIKNRSSVYMWPVYSASLLNSEFLDLSATAGKASGATRWNSTTPTASVFTVGTSATTNSNTENFVAYLFASVTGVSKVGSYTGNGSSQTINCGFTAGARFVLIKRTDSTGDWWVFDTARGIVSASDPALRINTTTAETTSVDSIDPDNSGFIVVQNATTNVNVSSASYIYLAIA